jgi:hypothetical protein
VAEGAPSDSVLSYATDALELAEAVLEIEDASAVLKLPPPSRWVLAVLLAFSAMLLVVSAGVVVIGFVVYLSSSAPRVTVGAILYFTFFGLLGTYYGRETVWAVTALRRWRRLGNRLEATHGSLVYVNCGVWHDRRRQWPLDKVQDFRVEPTSRKTRGGRYRFKLRAGRVVKSMRSSRPEFGEEVTAVIRKTLGLPPMETQLASPP